MGGVALQLQTGPILLPSYPLTYINLHIKYGNKICSEYIKY